jgi:hypothetical protein
MPAFIKDAANAKWSVNGGWQELIRDRERTRGKAATGHGSARTMNSRDGGPDFDLRDERCTFRS